MNEQLAKIGFNIQSIRSSKKLSLKEFATMCNSYPSFIGRIEKGLQNVSIAKLEQIAKALDVTVQELVGKTKKETLANRIDELSLVMQELRQQIIKLESEKGVTA